MLVLTAFALLPCAVFSAEATTGSIFGAVRDATGAPIANARVAAASPSGRYAAITNPQGRFVMLGVRPDTYIVSAQAQGYDAAMLQGVNVIAQARTEVSLQLQPLLHTIARVTSDHSTGPELGSLVDAFVVRGDGATARTPAQGAAGLGGYTRGTVQGALATVPGIMQDQFANAIVRAGKVQDTVFSYDSVPMPQGLISEPGGNVAGAQLATTGAGETSLRWWVCRHKVITHLAASSIRSPQLGPIPGVSLRNWSAV